MTTEDHPLQPFLPPAGRILFLGSFPPPKIRWSMEFFYPNINNDFWRIMGLLFFDDKNRFIVPGTKRFDHDAIVRFATTQGLGFFDTARRVCRLKDNASDNFLEIVEPTDVGALLAAMPACHTLVTTGQKAGEQLQDRLQAPTLPVIGQCVRCTAFGRDIDFWRMPSTSRAYPLALEKKAGFYRRLFTDL